MPQGVKEKIGDVECVPIGTHSTWHYRRLAASVITRVALTVPSGSATPDSPYWMACVVVPPVHPQVSSSLQSRRSRMAPFRDLTISSRPKRLAFNFFRMVSLHRPVLRTMSAFPAGSR